METSSNKDCSYLISGKAMPFCKGCGHTMVIRKLDEAMGLCGLDPHDVCLVTDIGCIGLVDALFDKVHTVHTTHGRSTAFATGIALADKVLADGKLKTIVLIGDGGSMIGLLHIVNAALLNADITVVVCNNFVFGMTGGQQSSLTPLDFVTQTSPGGNIIPPLDICSVAVASKADFAARKTASDKDLPQVLAKAIKHDGFSLVEVLELCTEHAVSGNDLKGSMLPGIAEEHGHSMGMIKDSNDRDEFSANYRKFSPASPEHESLNVMVKPVRSHNLEKKIEIIIAGSAGERVQSSAAMLCKAAMASGLFVTQKNDNPVTQGSGFSMSEVIISPEEILYTGADDPGAVIIVSGDGLKEAQNQGIFNRITERTILIIDESIAFDGNYEKIIRLPLRKVFGRERAAVGAVDYLISMLKPFPEKFWSELLAGKHSSVPEKRKLLKRQ